MGPAYLKSASIQETHAIGGLCASGSSSRFRRLENGADACHRVFEVALVELDADEVHAERGACHRGRAEPHEWIGDGAGAVEPVEPQAHLGQLRGKGGWMRPVFLAALDR